MNEKYRNKYYMSCLALALQDVIGNIESRTKKEHTKTADEYQKTFNAIDEAVVKYLTVLHRVYDVDKIPKVKSILYSNSISNGERIRIKFDKIIFEVIFRPKMRYSIRKLSTGKGL